MGQISQRSIKNNGGEGKVKKEYLAKLKQKLEEKDFDKSEINDIIDDYDRMYDDALLKGMEDADIMNFLGDPDRIAFDLCDGKIRKQNRKNNGKIVAIMPFVSLILFFIMGYAFHLWHPGWLVFLLIPVTAIIAGARKDKNGTLIALMPFIATAIYLGFGFGMNLWHPTWLIFFLIPVTAICSGQTRLLGKLTALTPFIAVTAFFILGEYGYYHPGWLVFFLIPMVGVLNEKHVWKAVIYEASFVIAIALYLAIGYLNPIWAQAWLVFLLPVIVSLLFGEYNFQIDGMSVGIRILTIVLIVIYVLFGFLFQTWSYLWLIFLLIPVAAIIGNGKGMQKKLVALSPFVATVAFFLLGYLGGYWQYSWMAFLLIPMTAILTKGKEE